MKRNIERQMRKHEGLIERFMWAKLVCGCFLIFLAMGMLVYGFVTHPPLEEGVNLIVATVGTFCAGLTVAQVGTLSGCCH